MHDAVVVAGGAWSRAFGDQLGVDVPVTPQRGQIAHLDPGATGHGPTGLQLGPYSGKLVADLVLGRDPGIDLSPFSVSRLSDE